MEAVLASTVVIPAKDVPREARRDLTIKIYNQGTGEVETHKCYKVRRGQFYMPRQYGLSFACRNGYDIIDDTSDGRPLGGKLKPIAMRDSEQEKWVEEVYDTACHYFDFRAQAPTGKGKTVMSLEVARRLDMTTVILVDQENLMDQWVERIKEHLKTEDIGRIQGDVCDYKHKFVVAMIQTLFRRPLPKKVYEYFGTCIIDECHVIGAPVFSTVLSLIPSSVRFGVSATATRRDALEKVIEYSIGAIPVEMEQKHHKSKVRVVESKGVYSWYANFARTTGRYINEIAQDGERNILIAKILSSLYDKDRTVLALSERIEHLHEVFSLCVQMGMPESNMGIYSRYHCEWKYAKDKTPSRVPKGYVKGTQYTPVALQLVRKKTTATVLEDILATRQIIFATYAMFSKGLDLPRLDTGLDMTPRSTFEQIHGRILRELPGKRVPWWVTIRDVNSGRAERQLAERLSEFSNVEVEQWNLKRANAQ